MTALTEALGEYIGSVVPGCAYSVVGGGNVFVEDMASEPPLAVALYSAGGTEGDTRLAYDAPDVQIIVRAGTEDPRPALALWAAIYHELHGLRNATLPGGVYLVWCIARSSSPARLGVDEVGRPRYSMNLRTEVINTAGRQH